MILLDTGIIFDFFAGHPSADKIEVLLKEARAAISAISVFELFNGVINEEHIRQREEFIKLCEIIGFNVAVARKASEIYTVLKKMGRLICNEDIMIAACGLHKDYPLFAVNNSHFAHIPGLILY